MATAADVVNEALALINNQGFVTGTIGNFTDGTVQNVTGTVANALYTLARDLVLSETNPEFARRQITGVPPAGLVAPITPWAAEYTYPSDGIRIRSVMPPASGNGSLADPNDPLPIRAAVAYDANILTPGKVVLTNQQNALLVYTTNIVGEAFWDSDFTEAVARRLANPFAMALAGRPDWARELLIEAERYVAISVENAEL
jgi:hypothetical protein